SVECLTVRTGSTRQYESRNIFQSEPGAAAEICAGGRAAVTSPADGRLRPGCVAGRQLRLFGKHHAPGVDPRIDLPELLLPVHVSGALCVRLVAPAAVYHFWNVAHPECAWATEPASRACRLPAVLCQPGPAL